MKTGTTTRSSTRLAPAQLCARITASLLMLSLAGCFEDEPRDAVTEAPSDGGSAGGSTTTPPPASTTNRAPIISGTPVTVAKTSLPYSFQPSARDSDGDKLTFSISGKPSWATFSASTGLLTGTPPEGSIGTVTGVQITVSDGKASSAMSPFDLNVVEPAVGSAQLTWQPSAMNEDGTALSDLSGYVIRYGKNYGGLDQSVHIDNPGVTIYILDNLVEGTWYFSVASVNSAGVESRPTGYVSRTIS